MPGGRVLLVDDHAGFRAAASRFLEADGLHVVGSVGTGEEAVDAARRLLPDIVLLDLMLPGADGVEVAHQLRSAGVEASVILISSRDDAAADLRVRSAPIRGFLPKRDLTCAAVLALAG